MKMVIYLIADCEYFSEGLVEQNAAGAQWAIPTGIERGISVLDRIPVSIETRGLTSSTNL